MDLLPTQHKTKWQIAGAPFCEYNVLCDADGMYDTCHNSLSIRYFSSLQFIAPFRSGSLNVVDILVIVFFEIHLGDLEQ